MLQHPLISDNIYNCKPLSDASQDYGMITDMVENAKNLTGPLLSLLKPVIEAIGGKSKGDDNSTDEPGQTGYCIT